MRLRLFVPLGRTSIIECLNFAVTGAYPPGGPKSQTFVYDPKKLNKDTVKAKVELQFQNTGGRKNVVVRPVEVVRKKGVSTSQQQEGDLTSWDRAGNPTRTKIECLELNPTIARLMVVSKAVLDYVVFCHQKDASWPLQLETGYVKTRFDEIFGCTGYVSALKVYLDLKADLASKVDGLQDELTRLGSLRQAAKSIRIQIKKGSSRKKKFRQDIQNLQGNSGGGDSVVENIARLKGQKKELKRSIRKAKVWRRMECEVLLLTSSECFSCNWYPHHFFQRKLSKYDNVDKEYRLAATQWTKTLKIMDEIKKHHDNVARGILKYHTLKIAEINQKLLELWMSIYPGDVM